MFELSRLLSHLPARSATAIFLSYFALRLVEAPLAACDLSARRELQILIATAVCLTLFLLAVFVVWRMVGPSTPDGQTGSIHAALRAPTSPR
jgi:hypothetical protein